MWRDQIKEDDDDVVVIMKHSFVYCSHIVGSER